MAAKFEKDRVDYMPGHGVRLIDIAAECWTFGVFEHLHGWASGEAFADQVKHAVDEQYGTAGLALVDKILAKPIAV